MPLVRYSRALLDRTALDRADRVGLDWSSVDVQSRFGLGQHSPVRSKQLDEHAECAALRVR